MKKCIAEFLGTFALVFAGTGAIIINDVGNHAITHVGIALTFGLVVLAMIYTVGDVSGAHLNLFSFMSHKDAVVIRVPASGWSVNWTGEENSDQVAEAGCSAGSDQR